MHFTVLWSLKLALRAFAGPRHARPEGGGEEADPGHRRGARRDGAGVVESSKVRPLRRLAERVYILRAPQRL